jgi:hypothetical protein
MGWIGRMLPLILLAGLSACGGGPRLAAGGGRTYQAPGPPDDPWGPYVREASGRFNVPERWIRAVMRQESGGREYLNGQPITSDAGAAGLMQLMPATYEELRGRYNLGADIYDPHDNIMAGTAYIGELYTHYGSPAFLAAYDAGPHRLKDYMAGRAILPNETVNYLAAVAPALGDERPMSGPLAAYADNGGAALTPDPVPRAYAPSGVAGCWRDPNAAYDPDAPCRPAPPAPAPAYQTVQADPAQTAQADATPASPTRPGSVLWGPGAPPLVAPVSVAAAGAPRAACWHDPDAAYDPDAPCQPPPSIASAPPPPAQPSPPPRHFAGNFLIHSAAAATLRPALSVGGWGVQVGAFASPDQALQVAQSARSLAPRELAGTRTVLGKTQPFGGIVLYRARLVGLSAQMAAAACDVLSARRAACITVPPGG